MQRLSTIVTLLIASGLGLIVCPNHATASPSCYGIDEAGNTLDLSQLCQPSSGVNSSPVTPNNQQPVSDANPDTDQETGANQAPEVSSREEGEKDLQACFNSPACIEIMEGSNEPQKTPHHIRIDQVMNGGAIK